MTIEIPSGVTTYITPLAQYQGATIMMDGVRLYDVKYCGDFAIYYLNSYGGWDAFLMEGKWERKDNLDIHTSNLTFDNTTLDFDKERYAAEIEVRYSMSTGWLTDEQAANFAKNLLQSNKVYLHNLIEDRIRPAVINNAEAPFKKYVNGRRLVAYTIDISESQTRMRR